MKIRDGDLFVSPVKGHVVARFGSARGGQKGQSVGVYPVLELKGGKQRFCGLRWDESEVVRIPRADYLAHLMEYDGAIAAGALKVRSKADHEVYLAKLEADAEKESAAQKKAASAAKSPEEKS